MIHMLTHALSLSFVCIFVLTDETVLLGVDFGTTFSRAGVYTNGRVEIIPIAQANRAVPSYVAWKDGLQFVGDDAKRQAILNPNNTVFGMKHMLGRKFNDKAVQSELQRWPFTVVEREYRLFVDVEVSDNEHKQLSAEEISALVLTELRVSAEAMLGRALDGAVITVPVYFNDAQRQAIKDACSLAGLAVQRIISEPMAAGIAYGVDQSLDARNILVYDLGGETLDVTVMELDCGIIEVLSTSGDAHLGGNAFDQRVMAYYTKQFEEKHQKDLTSDRRALQKLNREVERAKRVLSTSHQTRIEIESLMDGMDFNEVLTRTRFEFLNKDLFHQTIQHVSQALKEAEMTANDIHDVLLVGGSTYIPMIQQLLSEYFNGKQFNFSVHPDEAIAYGAAIQGGVIAGRFGEVQTAIMESTTVLSLGIETAGGLMATVLPRNMFIPTRKTKTFSTSEDNQTSVLIKIFEGERATTKDNQLLGQFELCGISPAPRGTPNIQVMFEIDVEGYLIVSATDLSTGNTAKRVFSQPVREWDDETIERMIRDGYDFADVDEKMKWRVDARNSFDRYCSNLRYHLAMGGHGLAKQLSDDERKRLRIAVEDAIDWLQTNAEADAEAIQSKQRELEELVTPIFQLECPSATDVPPIDSDNSGDVGHRSEL